MERTSKEYQAYINILKEELIPAMGCTEPIALAYAAAKARELLGCEPDYVSVKASGSIIKNVKSVIVPNTDKMKGIEVATAAGIVAGDPSQGLEVISKVTKEQIKEIRKFLEKTKILVKPLYDGCIFELIIELKKENQSSLVRIANYHTNIVRVEKNGEVLLDKPLEEETHGLTERSLMSMEGIWDFACTVDLDDVKDIIKRQIDFNWAIAEEGMTHDYGANIGQIMLEIYGDNVRNKACAMAAAGSDARMNGCELPVVINSGSGNQGITVSIPVIVYAKELNVNEEQLYRALVLSNLTAIHQKTGVGRLSAYCGVVCAGAGAAAGIGYLQGGSYKEITHTIVNTLAVVSGMICDGAKSSCAAKIGTAVNSGILGYEMYKRGKQFYDGEGIVQKGVESTINNIGILASKGMRVTNEEIIRIMTGL